MAQSVSFQELTLPIQGMTCGGCATTIRRALTRLPGVQEATVDLSAQQAQVTYNPALVGLTEMAKAVTKAGYIVEPEAADAPVLPTLSVGAEQTHADAPPVGTQATQAARTPQATAPSATPVAGGYPWQRPVLFSLLGIVGLMLLYLGIVSLAEGWTHAVELLVEDAWLVGPIMAGFGVQVGLYTYLKTVLHAAAQGTGALAGAGGGTSTAAMVACCAHHVTDIMPLLGLSAAATFLAEYRIPFMLVGLATNLIGIGVISFLILRQRRCLVKCSLEAQPAESTCH